MFTDARAHTHHYASKILRNLNSRCELNIIETFAAIFCESEDYFKENGGN